MLYIVEVGSAGDLAAVMSRMRTWLDHYRVQVENFRHCRGTAGGKFRLEFNDEFQATAFASAFDGRVLPPEPQAPPLVRTPRRPTRIYRHRLHGRYSRSSRPKQSSG
jgi:hypothetical protein